MLLATISILLPAVGRLWFYLVGVSRVFPPLIVTSVVVWCFIDDWRKRGRVHPAYLIGGSFIVASFPLRFYLGNTAAWQAFAH